MQGGAVPDVCAAAGYGMHDRLREILQREPGLANDRMVCLWGATGVGAHPARPRRHSCRPTNPAMPRRRPIFRV
jgi:hypothetical protein